MSLLELKGITQRFGGLLALNDVNISINQGEIIGIIGPNGAGKSTLFNAIIGLVPPTSGEVLFNGDRITYLPVHQIVSKGVTKTSQTVQVFGEMTVLENVLVGSLLSENRVSVAKEKAMEKLKVLGLEDSVNRLASDLTLAERAKLELARAIAVNPKVLMVDELMAGLNEIEVNDTIERFKLINSEFDVTLLIIEHNMEAIMRLSHRVIVLENGSPIVEGDPVTVSKDPRVVKAYLGVE
jgi:branched-chain amino acid transport system ATP-binding protein